MASRVSKQQLLESEFEELTTMDPEMFFDAMLISIRGATMQPLDSNVMEFQKKVFKRWFSEYNRALKKAVLANRKPGEDYIAGKRAGELHTLLHLPTRAVHRGVLIDMRLVYDRIKELEA